MLVLAECVCVMHKESQKSVAKIKIYLDSSDSVISPPLSAPAIRSSYLKSPRYVGPPQTL